MSASEPTCSLYGASCPVPCSEIKIGSCIVLGGRPSKIVDMTVSKTGKHGPAKAHMICLDIFTGDKREHRCSTKDNLDVPVVQRTEYPVLSMDDEGFVSLLTPKGETKDDLKVTAQLHAQLAELLSRQREVVAVVVRSMDEERVMSLREVKEHVS